MASTGTEQALYVAMENGTAPVYLGAYSLGAPAALMTGDMSVGVLDASAWTAFTVWKAHQSVRGFLGL